MATSSKKFSTFLGKNEHLSRSDLQIKEGLYVADAKNVDIALPGRFMGRRGYAKVVPGTNMHSLWVSGTGRALVVSAGQLCALDVRSKQLQPLDFVVPPSATLAYTDLPDGDIAVSDGRTMARIKPDNSMTAMIALAPSPVPVVTADDPPAVRDQVRTVRFALTTDYGLTWSEVLPTGLPSLDATKLGSVMVVKAMRTTSVLAVTAWDESSKAYWVYTSKNDGLTWTQGAKVVDGAFMAMDEVLTIDGTSGSSSPRNLTFLTPLLDAQGQPAKVNAGAPWAHDASKKLPAGPV